MYKCYLFCFSGFVSLCTSWQAAASIELWPLCLVWERQLYIDMCTCSVKLYAGKKMNTSNGTHQRKRRLLHNYRSASTKYPQAIGAIDGSHIPINAPLDGKADYLCRKGYPSIVLQAVVDTHIKFRDVYANTAGARRCSVLSISPIKAHRN